MILKATLNTNSITAVILPAKAKSFASWLSSMCVATSVAVTAIPSLQPISTVTLKKKEKQQQKNKIQMSQAKEETKHCAIFIQRHRDLEISPWRGKTLSDLWVIHTSAALLPVLGPSLSNTLGLRDGAAGLVLLLVVVLLLLLLSDMVFEFSTVTFRLILDILQDCKYDKQRSVNSL